MSQTGWQAQPESLTHSGSQQWPHSTATIIGLTPLIPLVCQWPRWVPSEPLITLKSHPLKSSVFLYTSSLFYRSWYNDTVLLRWCHCVQVFHISKDRNCTVYYCYFQLNAFSFSYFGCWRMEEVACMHIVEEKIFTLQMTDVRYTLLSGGEWKGERGKVWGRSIFSCQVPCWHSGVSWPSLLVDWINVCIFSGAYSFFCGERSWYPQPMMLGCQRVLKQSAHEITTVISDSVQYPVEHFRRL